MRIDDLLIALAYFSITFQIGVVRGRLVAKDAPLVRELGVK